MTDHNERACRYCGSLLHVDHSCGRGEGARAAYLAMAEECERRAATEVRWRAKTLRVDGHICLEDEMASEARENATRWLAAWARGRAGA